MNSAEIRKKFVQFFEQKGHKKWPSSGLIPIDDPTLLFVNAGMVQFKDYFTGRTKAPDSRVVTVQKCVRAGGKHNDLENVGFTARHHTFFEMLGNFSFGDYFKSEAIHWAWEFLTQELKLPADKLIITAHHSDQEAADIWLKQIKISKDRFFFRGDKDNFWEMGETGPCGPCSEIFFDHGPEHSDPKAVIKDCPLDDEGRYVEIWNLVFMQFERYREADKILQRPLPNPCIDTGSGLERLTAALQGVYNNYDTDLFQGIVGQVEKLSGHSYSEPKAATSMRVVADHVRASTMLITDGVLPSNEGRGYVLRRILRRAIRHLNALGIEEPVLHKLVPAVFASLGEEYTENLRHQELAEKYLLLEEQSFRKTLQAGLNLLDREIHRLKSEGQSRLEGKVVFQLYDTQGFPVDLTELLLKEQGLEMDHQGFAQLMAEQKERSRRAGKFSAQEDQTKVFYALKENLGATNFLGYEKLHSSAQLLKVVPWNEDQEALIFDQTPFYAESGGQAGDQGEVIPAAGQSIEVVDTLKPIEGLHVHIVAKGSDLKEGQTYALKVNPELRAATARNHTATHLLHSALRQVLGRHVQQAGSYVGPDRLRFDFSHPESMTSAQLQEVEHMINAQIFKNTPVCPEVTTKDEALKKGALALFGEKYGSEVRVIGIEDFSTELCGGTHVAQTADIHLFSILSESSLASGVRRIEAVTGLKALEKFERASELLGQVQGLLHSNGPATLERLVQLQEELKAKDKELRSLKEKQQAQSAQSLFAEAESLKSGVIFKAVFMDSEGDLKSLSDLFMDKHPKGVVLLSAPKEEGKASVLLRSFKGNSQVNCAQILKEALSSLGGRGGGKPDMAQGSLDLAQLPALKEQVVDQLEKS